MVNNELNNGIESKSNMFETNKYGGYFKFEIDIKSQTYTTYHRDDSTFIQKYEYKINGTDVYERVLEQHQSGLGYDTFKIRDGVVIESEIRREYREHSLVAKCFGSIEERINEYKKETEWHKMTVCETKYFILSKHPEYNSKNEFRRFLRTEEERLKNGIEQFKIFVSKYNEFIIQKDNNMFPYPLSKKEINEEVIEKIRSEYQKFMKNNNINENETENTQDILDTIAKYLKD